LQIGIGTDRHRYLFTLTEDQQKLIRKHDNRYGLFQAHQTSDRLPHACQYAGLSPESVEQCHEDAITIAFSFTFKSRAGGPAQSWLTAVLERGHRTSLTKRAYFALSVKEYALGTHDGTASPARFRFPGRLDTAEDKLWEQKAFAIASWISTALSMEL